MRHAELPAPNVAAQFSTVNERDIVAFHEGLSQMPAAQWLEARSSEATIALRSREMVDMLTAAVDGLGLAVLPCGLGDPEPTLRRLTPEMLAPRPLWLVHRAEARLVARDRLAKSSPRARPPA